MHKLRNRLGPLRVLDAVYRSGGVGRAAELLHVTPGAVSHQLRRLESELGVQLVQKDGRDIAFTAVGTELALQAAELFDQLEGVLAKAAEAGANRRIRVKVIPSFAIKWLMPRLGSLYVRHGDIDIEIATVARADDTDLHNADFVVRCGDGDWPGLRADLLFPDELVLACSPALAERLRRPEDVLGETLLKSMIAPDCWDRWLQSAGLAASGDTPGSGSCSTGMTSNVATSPMCTRLADMAASTGSTRAMSSAEPPSTIVSAPFRAPFGPPAWRAGKSAMGQLTSSATSLSNSPASRPASRRCSCSPQPRPPHPLPRSGPAR